MKKIILICLLIFVFGCSEERDSRLMGTWLSPVELHNGFYVKYQFSEEGQVTYTKEACFGDYRKAFYGRWNTEADHKKLYITWESGATGEQLIEYSWIAENALSLREIVDFKEPQREEEIFFRNDD